MVEGRSMMYEDYTPKNKFKQRMKENEQLRIKRRDATLKRFREFEPYYDTNKVRNLQEIKEKIKTKDLTIIAEGVIEFRTLLSTESCPPIQTVINSGVVPRFVELLSKKASVFEGGEPLQIKKIRLESAWVLTNIASGSSEQTKVVVDFGACPLLVEMLEEQDENYIDQAIWALGNIAGDCERMRDMIIFSNGTQTINSIGMKLISDSRYIKVLRNLTWLLSNLNRGSDPFPPIESSQLSLNLLIKLVEIPDAEILSDSFWCISYICESSQECTDFVLRSSIKDRFLKELGLITSSTIARGAASPLIRLCGIIAGSKYGNMLSTNEVIMILVDIFNNFNSHRRRIRIRKEICWVFSNLTSNPLCEIQRIYNCGIIQLLKEGLESDSIVRQEACFAISNIISHKEAILKNIDVYKNADLIVPLVTNLDFFSHCSSVQRNILLSLEVLIECGAFIQEGRNPIAERLVDCGIKNVLVILMNAEDPVVKDKSTFLYNSYFINRG